MIKYIMPWLTLLVFISCAHQIPDVELCATGSEYQGLCATSISSRKRTIPPVVWQEEVYNRLSISADDYGKLKSFIKKVCLQSSCSREAQKKIDHFKMVFGH